MPGVTSSIPLRLEPGNATQKGWVELPGGWEEGNVVFPTKPWFLGVPRGGQQPGHVDWAYFFTLFEPMQLTLVQQGARAAAACHQFRYLPPLVSRTCESKRLVATEIYTPSARVNLISPPLLSQDKLSVCENVP